MSTMTHRSLESSSAQDQMKRLATKLIDSVVQNYGDDQKDLEEVDPYNNAAVSDECELYDQTIDVKLKAVVADDDDDDAKELEAPIKAEQMKEDEMEQLNALPEDDLINSERFATEFGSALEHVTDIAKAHRIEMVDAAKANFHKETGLEATPKMVEDALKPFATATTTQFEEQSEMSIEESDDEEINNLEEEIDEATLASEMEAALEIVRALGRSHQAKLVNTVCDLYAENNDGAEMSTKELSSLFSGIRSDLAQEAEMAVEEDRESIDGELAEGELESALAVCRELGRAHQPALIESICATVREVRGAEPNAREISHILARVKAEFAAEARDEFLEHFAIDDSADLNYDPKEDTDTFLFHRDCADDVDDGEDDEDGEELSDEYSPARDAFDYKADLLDDIDFDNADSADAAESDSSDDERTTTEQSISLWISETRTSLSGAKAFSVRFNESSPKAITKRSATAAEKAQLSRFLSAQPVSVEKLEVRCEVDDFDAQLDSALEHVRELAKLHRAEFVEAICRLFDAEHGREPDADELRQLFSEIQSELAEEAREEQNDASTSEAATPIEHEAATKIQSLWRGARVRKQLKAQAQYDDDLLITTTEVDTSLLVSATTTSRTGNAEAFSVYFEESSMRTDLSKAVDSFRMRNKRSPSAAERKHIQQFLSTNDEVEEVTVSAVVDLLDESVDEAFEERREAEFALSQMDSALRHVRELGVSHQGELVDAMCAIYCWHHGDAPSLAELYALFGAMKGLFAEEAQYEEYPAFESELEKDSDAETESESETESADQSERDSYAPSEDSFDYALDAESEVDADSEATVELDDDAFVVRGVAIDIGASPVMDSAFASVESDAELGEEMDSALAHVRELAKLHQEPFVNSICDLYRESNGGVEASQDQLFGIFDFIKKELAIEAHDECYDEESTEEEDEDESESEASEYDPDSDTFDYCLDIEDDCAPSEDESESETDADTSLLISETTTSRTGNAEAFSVYFEESSMRSDFIKAVDSFRMRNKRSPTSAERKHIRQFLSTHDEVEEVTVNVESVESESEDSELSLVQSDTFSAEWQSAIEHVEKLASHQQEAFVNSICDLYRDSNDGAEPSTTELRGIFSDIKKGFAEEAWDEHDDEDTELESEDAEEAEDSESADVDYSPDDDAFDYCLDIEDDFGFITDVESVIESDSDADAEADADSISLLISETITSRTGTAEAFSVYFGERSMRSDVSKAVDSFRMRNKRSPTSAERKHIRQFLSTHDEVEEVTVSAVVECANESELIHSAHFAEEWHSAIAHVKQLASAQKESMLLNAAFDDADVTVDMVADALSRFAVEPRDDIDDDGDLAESDRSEYEREMASALRSVCDLGRRHRLQFACRLIDVFSAHNEGRHPDAEEMAQMFSSIVEAFADEAAQQTDGEDDECLDDEAFEEELDSAIEHVRDLGTQRQPALVNRICNIFAARTGMEATLQHLTEMFGCIKASFVNEVKEDFLAQDSGASADEATDFVRGGDDSLCGESMTQSDSAESEKDYSESGKDSESEQSESVSESEAEESSSSLDESNEFEESVSERSDDSGDGKDSDDDDEYDPDQDTFDYCRDIEEDHLASTDSDSEEDDESESAC